MRKTLSCAAMVAMIALAWRANPSLAQENAPAKKAAVKKKAAATKKGASSHGKKTTAKRGVTWRNRQMSPSPDRYREIQGALAAKGFLKPEDATGTDRKSTR